MILIYNYKNYLQHPVDHQVVKKKAREVKSRHVEIVIKIQKK